MKRNLTNELDKELCKLQQEDKLSEMLNSNLTDEEINDIILRDGNYDSICNSHHIDSYIDEMRDTFIQEYHNDMLDSFGSLEWLNDSKYDYCNTIGGVIVG